MAGEPIYKADEVSCHACPGNDGSRDRENNDDRSAYEEPDHAQDVTRIGLNGTA
jgi:hypothetical protein